MNSKTASEICAVLSTMDAYVPWRDDTALLMEERYLRTLLPLPDTVGAKMLEEVDQHFARRPSVKELSEWATGLTPPPVYTSLPAPEADQGESPEVVGPPPHVREMMRRLHEKYQNPLRAGTEDDALRGDWGLNYSYTDSRPCEVMPPHWTEAEARRRAAEFNRKFQHCSCQAYQAKKGMS